MTAKLIDRLFLWWLERRLVTVNLKSEGLEVSMAVGGIPVFATVEYTPDGHWHQRQIGPVDEYGMAEFEADWISGAAVCEDCPP